ncbi:hypothetical protein BDW59DRAFT_159056 [Aspergillus cavernicola]|uniref:FAD-binding PCMH-type domain-containing protein n=1 Tax=Aspergillus cavernicola TaxID=176166 RepID=A0ABR4IRM8_9EURO
MSTSIRRLLSLGGIALLGLVDQALCQNTTSAGRAGAIEACDRLRQEFRPQLFPVGTSNYEAQSHLPWSETCLLTPQCVFLPSDASDVARAVQIIADAQSPFAVISGGHMPVPGAASTPDGVLISLHALTTLALSDDRSILHLGPGNLWGEVYNYTSQYGLAVNGGRYGQVGVGGLLVGGGIGYFSSQYGWGANTVVEYEVVLANGTVAVVRADSHPDLFWALKGGSNYFGIVTRYDMKTFPANQAYSSAQIRPGTPAVASTWFNALNAYLAPGGGVEDVRAAIMPIVALTPENGTYEVINLEFYADPIARPRAFENFTSIPGPTLMNETVVAPWTYLSSALDIPAYAAKTSRQAFWSFSFLPDPRAISITNRTIFGEAATTLTDITGSTVTLSYQPISQAWLEAARAAGGDVLDLDPEDGPFVAGLLSTTWEDPEDDERMYAFNREVVDSINQQNTALGLHHPFVYLNDAGPGQAPFSGYGGGRILPRLQSIQARYDRDGVFRDLLAHGFPLRG